MTSVKMGGYYGGVRLIKAALKVLFEYGVNKKINITTKGFEITYDSDIPMRLGLAGSSAIITATIKALMEYFDVEIEKPELANLILSVETEELGIAAGLQDRVAQVYEQPVYMSFDKQLMVNRGFGEYIPFENQYLSNLYIAFSTQSSEGSEVVHNDLRERFESGESNVVKAMERFAELTDEVFTSMKSDNPLNLGSLLNENFDLRNEICEIQQSQKEMIEIARSCGASAKFTGSGGALIGQYEDDKMFDLLKVEFSKHGIQIIQPEIVEHVSH